MLRIRLSRVGKTGKSCFRVIIVNSHKQAKSAGIEILGNYLPWAKNKALVLKNERVEYWLKHGALPTPSVASLLKKQGFENMDRFLETSIKKAVKKGEKPAETAVKESVAEAKPKESVQSKKAEPSPEKAAADTASPAK